MLLVSFSAIFVPGWCLPNISLLDIEGSGSCLRRQFVLYRGLIAELCALLFIQGCYAAMFDSAATELIKKPFFFPQMLCVEGFGLYFSMFNEVSCPARRQTSHCLVSRLRPAVV